MPIKRTASNQGIKLTEQGRVPKGTIIFRNKKQMIQHFENMKWREAPESAPKGQKVQPKKLEELHKEAIEELSANLQSDTQEKQKD